MSFRGRTVLRRILRRGSKEGLREGTWKVETRLSRLRPVGVRPMPSKKNTKETDGEPQGPKKKRSGRMSPNRVNPGSNPGA